MHAAQHQLSQFCVAATPFRNGSETSHVRVPKTGGWHRESARAVIGEIAAIADAPPMSLRREIMVLTTFANFVLDTTIRSSAPDRWVKRAQRRKLSTPWRLRLTAGAHPRVREEDSWATAHSAATTPEQTWQAAASAFNDRLVGLSTRMARAEQTEINLRIVIEQPVIGVLHSLQAKDDLPLDSKRSRKGEPLVFDFPVRVAPGPKFFGDQVRREGPVRRFVYIRVGQLAGDPSSPWSRRMKIDIHDIGDDLLDRAARGAGVIETTVIGTAEDGTPTCATVRPTARHIARR